MLKKINWILITVFLSAFLLRLSLVFVAHHGDLNNNLSWGKVAYERSLSGFYENPPVGGWPYSNPNQPPLTILTFAATHAVWQKVTDIFKGTSLIWWWQDKGIDLLVKLPGILADLVIAWMIYKYTKKLSLAAVWLFNPVIWYNSTIWGQTESIVNLLMFASVIFLLKKDLSKALTFLALCLLFKGSLALLFPLVIVYALYQKYPIKKWLAAIYYGLVVVVFVSVWFHPRLDLFVWLFNLYKQRIFPGEIGYLSANAFNFWWLVNPGKVLDSTIYFGLPARIWGIIVTLAGLGTTFYWLRKKITPKKLFLSFTILSLVSFLFMTRIHERYLYPFFLPATILLGSVPGMIIPYVVLSITHLFNLYHLFWAPGISFLINLYRYPQFPIALSLINILIFIYILRLLKVKS
jgi:Gpi18-like mannosyltransferase